MLGKGSAAAKPNCNRYVEEVCAKLVLLHPNVAKRVPKVHADYEHIRTTLVRNGTIAAMCHLNIPPLNQHTLGYW